MSQYYNLYLIIIVFLFLLITIVLIVKKIGFGRKRVYKAKGPYLLSPGEKIFFDALVNAIGSDMYVCPKVRIADLVEVDIPKTDKGFWPSFNKISQKHVDFVVCKRSDFSPLLIIELDGGSHEGKSRALRDALVDNVFKDTNIPILHIKPTNSYDYKVLSEEVSKAIKSLEPETQN